MDKNTNKEPGKLFKENPFQVPDGYFDSLSGKITQKIREQDSIPEKKKYKIQPLYKWVAAAAILVLSIFVFSHLLTDDKNAITTDEQMAFFLDYAPMHWKEVALTEIISEDEIGVESEINDWSEIIDWSDWNDQRLLDVWDQNNQN